MCLLKRFLYGVGKVEWWSEYYNYVRSSFGCKKLCYYLFYYDDVCKKNEEMWNKTDVLV